MTCGANTAGRNSHWSCPLLVLSKLKAVFFNNAFLYGEPLYSHRVLTATIYENGCLLYRRFGTRGESIGQTTLAAVLTIIMEGHEDTSTALGSRALTTEALDLAVGFDLVVLQNRHLDLLTLVLDLLGGLYIGTCKGLHSSVGQLINSRCRSSSSSFCHHRGGGGPSGEWTPSGYYWEFEGY